MEENVNSNLFELQIDHQSSAYLSETAKWTKFLSILGFIFCGLIVIIAIFFGSYISSTFSKYETAGARSAGSVVIFVYVLIALIYFFPCLYLFNFSNKMQIGLKNNDQEQLNLSFKNLRSCFKFLGILTIVILGFYLLVLIFALFAGIASR
jgi:Family of unknown function (DUF5362)